MKFALFVKCQGCNQESYRDAEYEIKGEGALIVVPPCPKCAAEQSMQRTRDSVGSCEIGRVVALAANTAVSRTW